MTDRLLLVDDEKNILSALARELDNEGFEIATCGGPAEALAVIDREEFAVIVSDNVMPGGSGLDLLAAARDRWPLTRRLLLTGATELEDAVAAFNDGSIHRFIHKPWQRTDLIHVLHKEAEIYRTERDVKEKQAMLEAVSKTRTAKLLDTMDELKQSRTQVALLEDAETLKTLELPARLAGLSIWVVDENDAVRDLLVSTLQKAGIKRSLGIRSGTDVLWRIQSKQEVDVILSEWKMQPLDGMALFNRLRQEGSPAARVKFVLVTGREQRPLVEFALKSGVDGYIIKPFRLQALLDQVDLVLRKDSGRQTVMQGRLASLACLVVNQHSASCDQIAALLAAAGMDKVTTVHSGSTGLRMLTERRIDLLVYDLNVKTPEWRTLLKELGRMPHSPAVLFTSVLPTQEERDAMHRERIPHFLPGPFAQAELLDAVVRAAGLQADEQPPRQPGN